MLATSVNEEARMEANVPVMLSEGHIQVKHRHSPCFTLAPSHWALIVHAYMNVVNT